MGEDLVVFHPQFVDDTILFIKPEFDYILNLKHAILLLNYLRIKLNWEKHESCSFALQSREIATQISWSPFRRSSKLRIFLGAGGGKDRITVIQGAELLPLKWHYPTYQFTSCLFAKFR